MKKFGKILGICIAVLCLSLVLVACDVPSPTSIAVKTNPSETVYYVGDTLNVGGGVLEITYDDDSKEEIGLGAATISAVDMSTPGTKEVTATYKSLTTKFSITVKEAVATKLEVKTFLQNVEIFTSTDINKLKDYIAVVANFDDGTGKFLAAADYTLSAEDWTKGEKTVTVKYGESETTFVVTVLEVMATGEYDVQFDQGDLKIYITDDITAKQGDTKPESPASIAIKDKLIVKEFYNDGSEKILTNAEYSIFVGNFETSFSSTGRVEMMVAKQPTNPKFTVTVLDDPLLSIAAESSVTEMPQNTTLAQLKSKISVIGTYIYAGNKAVKADKVTLSLPDGADKLALGDNVVTVTVGTETTTVTIKGLKVLESATAVYTADGQVLKVGDRADSILPKLVVTLTYSDGTTETATEDQLEIKAAIVDWMGPVESDTFTVANTQYIVLIKIKGTGIQVSPNLKVNVIAAA